MVDGNQRGLIEAPASGNYLQHMGHPNPEGAHLGGHQPND